jgi:hypothetical protein
MNRFPPIFIALALLAGCGPASQPGSPPPEVFRGESRFGLTFEQRMALAAQLSRLRGEAQKRAGELYDPFRSRENAIRNDEYSAEQYQAARRKLLNELNLTDEQLDEIVREYQASLGGSIR